MEDIITCILSLNEIFCLTNIYNASTKNTILHNSTVEVNSTILRSITNFYVVLIVRSIIYNNTSCN